MKRLFSIVFLVLFSFNIGGFFLFFSIQKFQIRREIKNEIKENLPLSTLARITITPANKEQVFWEHEKEFRYHGIMYDVVRKEVIDNLKTVYYCITDTQETTLFKKLDTLVARNMEGKKGGAKSLQYFFRFLSNLYSFNKENMVFYSTINYFLTDIISFYNQPWVNILSPPPQFYSSIPIK